MHNYFFLNMWVNSQDLDAVLLNSKLLLLTSKIYLEAT